MKQSEYKFLDKNVRSVYDILKNPGKFTRTEIASKTGISITTVTNIVDMFVEKGMVRFQYSKKHNTKYVSLHPERYILVYDLTEPRFRTLVLDLNGDLKNIFYSPNLVYSPYRMIDEEIAIHIRDTEWYISSMYKRFHCIGVAYLMPGHFDIHTMKVVSPRFPQINRLDFDSILSNNTMSQTTVLCDMRECYLQIASDNLGEDEIGLAVFIEKNEIATSLIKGCSNVTVPFYAPFGKAVIRDGHMLESISKFIEEPSAVANIIAEEIRELSKRVPLNQVFIFGNRYDDFGEFRKLISEELNKKPAFYLPSVNLEINNCSVLTEIVAKVRDKRYLNKK